MFEVIGNWFKRHFSDPQVVMLAVLLLVGFLVVIYFGEMLTPVLASLVIAYLLEGLIGMMQRHGVPRLVAVWAAFLLFIIALLFLLLGMVPLLSAQVAQFVHELPRMITTGQEAIMRLPERYPDFINQQQLADLLNSLRAEIATAAQGLLAFSLSSITNIVTLVVYLVLLPLLVFFFLKDKQLILDWASSYLPQDRRLASSVWDEVNGQLSNYVRGKFWEILVVGLISYITFETMGLQYAMLLGALVGLSVIVPYIGAAVVTFPVAIIAFFQWGTGNEFIYLMVAYGVIQALDGNVLVPLLFSEAVNLHPIAIIVAVLVFGGLWGIWGVFFAIPLATLVKAVLTAWPRATADMAASPE
ncbi:AI-2E family transporter [Sulfuriflexus sp.]|uniref:AI-2E family transporter n=1 Tax=Sulfuriflexus sp. TaxID=2015443 RepID=UPI0028CCCA67|nr:AI-2E family transporter [Sulfuriflexus sp.]MDT8403304.1 AI-2E family transporter [Sulfuriflexus sp.]